MATGVEAATVTYTSSTAFLAALGSTATTTETYEGIPFDTVIPDGSSLNGIDYIFNSSTPRSLEGRIDGGNYNRIDSASLAAAGVPSTDDFFFPGDSITVTFPTAVTAVGLFFNANTTASTSDIFLQTPVGTATTGGSVYDVSTFFFAGIISDTPFTTATFGSVLGSTPFNVDNLTYAPSPTAATPEPASTLGLLSLGAGLLASKRRKQEK